jgi:hypothetical protein
MKQNLGHLSIENSTLARFSTAVGLSDKNLIQFVTPAQYAPFAKREDLLWRSLWDFLRDDLSLQRFFMSKTSVI